MLLNLILSFGSYLLFCFLQFRIAKKAKIKHSWLAFVPIVQIFQYLKLAKVSGWWFLGLLVPFLNLGVIIWVSVNLARNFGEKKGFGILLLLPPVNFWAMWKLGKKDKTPPLSADDQESVNEIKHALEGGYSADVIKDEALKLGLSGIKVDLLFSLANQKPKPAAKTKTWLIVLLAILEIPLFFGMIFLILFSIIAPLLFSEGVNIKDYITFSTNESEPVVEETVDIEKPEVTENVETEVSEYGEEINLEGLDGVTIQFAKEINEDVETFLKRPDIFWNLGYKINNKTAAKVHIKTLFKYPHQSESDFWNNADFSVDANSEHLDVLEFKKFNINFLNVGVFDFWIEPYECDDNYCEDTSNIIGTTKQKLWYGGWDESPKVVSVEESLTLDENLKQKTEDSLEEPLSYDITLVPDNELLEMDQLDTEKRSFQVYIKNNDRFTSLGLKVSCEFLQEGSTGTGSFLAKDTTFKDFDNHNAYLVKSLPADLFSEEINGVATCDVIATCDYSDADIQDESRFCKENEYVKKTEDVVIYTEEFEFEVLPGGGLIITEKENGLAALDDGLINKDEDNEEDELKEGAVEKLRPSVKRK